MARTATSLEVLRTEPLGPHMIRVVLGGDELARFPDTGYTDRYVKLLFTPPGVEYPEPFDVEAIRRELPREQWPRIRTYTVRRLDHDAGELTIDFVHHGDSGVAGPWAAAAQPGDTIHLRGPSGAYAPDRSADWHLFVGDEAGLPAIAASLESLGPDDHAVAFIEVDGPEHELPIATAATLELHWLHRGDAAAGSTTLLDEAVRSYPWRDGRVQAFVHGESALLKSVRPYLLSERGVPRSDLSVSAYWRRGTTEEGFRTWKSQQQDAIMRPGG